MNERIGVYWGTVGTILWQEDKADGNPRAVTLHDFLETFGMEIVVIGDLASTVTYCNHATVEGKNAELSDLTGGTVEEAEEFTQVVK